MNGWRRLPSNKWLETINRWSFGWWVESNKWSVVHLKLVYATILMPWVELARHTRQTFLVFADREVVVAEPLQRALQRRKSVALLDDVNIRILGGDTTHHTDGLDRMDSVAMIQAPNAQGSCTCLIETPETLGHWSARTLDCHITLYWWWCAIWRQISCT